MFKFEDLRIYKESLTLSNNIYSVTKTFPKEEAFGLTNQLRRAAVSVALNIAEGSSRTKKDFKHFLDLARGSCYECIAILAIARDQQYILDSTYSELYQKYNTLTKQINALRLSLQKP